MKKLSLISAMVLALVLVACGESTESGGSGDPVENGAGEQGEGAGSELPAPEAPEEMEDPFGDFDREEARERAESYLGVSEENIEEEPMVRVVRRGDEDYMVTMDLRPGRMNLELDDDGSGTYVVTRIMVETPEGGDDNIIIE